MNVFEAGGAQALRRCERIHHNQRGEQMKETERAATATIGAGKRSTRPKDARNFCEQTTLQRRRRNVMEHGKTNSAIEGITWKRHGGAVFAANSHIVAERLLKEPFRQLRVDLHAGEPVHFLLHSSVVAPYPGRSY